MASISAPPSFPSPFDAPSPPASPRRPHRRMPSRNSNPAELPSFVFNPSVIEISEATEAGDENVTEDDTMDLSARRSLSKAVPLPDFKFNPGADLPTERSPSPTHPVLQEMVLNQQRATKSARPAPLPPFTFAPYSSSTQPSPSPTRSSFADMPHSAGGGIGIGHRRRGSEFVGGGTGGTQLISTSPEKPEYRPPPVSGYPRGHTHRRSQAISISEIDTSDLIKANALSKSRTGSTPTTPSESQQHFVIPRQSPPSRASVSYTARSPPNSPRRRDSAPGVRPRVGFADRVDVIPRPLSLISSETEGSCSTIRGGHSLSGSINSIASPAPRPASNVSSPILPEIESPQVRPKTADPSTLFPSNTTTTDRAMSMISLPKRPLSASGSPAVTLSGSPPTKKKHFWFSSNHSSPSATPHSEKEDPLATTPILPQLLETDAPRPRTSPERSASVKKRKYHTWTSGIFSKKAGKRSSKPKSKRNPTPPVLQRRTSDKINQIFDQDDTVVLREPSPVAQRSRPRPMTTIIPATSYSFPASQTETTTPVIDLDAAMGFGDDEKAHGTPTRTAASRIAKLHSSERRGNIDAFGSFHKRAESAPMLQPVNRNTFGVHIIGSNTSLSQDMFDEEEEDNFLAHETTSKCDSETSPPPTKDGNEEKMESGSPDLIPSALRTQSVDGLGLSVQSDASDTVIIVDPEEDLVTLEQRSSKSTLEAPVLPEELAKRPATSPMMFSYSAPQSHYASSTEGRTTSASMISSPDPEHISFENFPRTTRYLTEPSPDFVLRASNEDLPSLSDSISSGALPRMSSSANTRSSVEQRSASVYVPATSKASNTAWKRASLASLNRLIPGSANGSKLKFETTPDAAADEKTKKKTNRISKLMTFWRSKEKGDA